jgi:hypothetical protein
MIIMMRTTLNLPDDIYEIVKSVAADRDLSLGDAVADLVRRGLRPQRSHRDDTIFPCFSVPEDAPPITLEQTLSAEDEP